MTDSHEDTQTEQSAPAQKKKAKSPANIRVRVSWCKGCGLCVDYCPTGAIEMEGVLPKVVDAEKCTRCLQCEAVCPDFAIEIDPPSGGVTVIDEDGEEDKE